MAEDGENMRAKVLHNMTKDTRAEREQTEWEHEVLCHSPHFDVAAPEEDSLGFLIDYRLNRQYHKEPLGFHCVVKWQYVTVVKIKKHGPLDETNKWLCRNPGTARCCIRSFDLLVQVNGIRGDPVQMVAELDTAMTLYLVVRRPPGSIRTIEMGFWCFHGGWLVVEVAHSVPWLPPGLFLTVVPGDVLFIYPDTEKLFPMGENDEWRTFIWACVARRRQRRWKYGPPGWVPCDCLRPATICMGWG